MTRHKFAAYKDTTGVWLCESCPKSFFFTKSKFDKHMKENHSSLSITAKGLGFQKYTNLKWFFSYLAECKLEIDDKQKSWKKNKRHVLLSKFVKHMKDKQ